MANTLSVADYKTIMDAAAAILDVVEVAYGDEVTGGTCVYGAVSIRDMIVAFTDPDDWDIELDLLSGSVALVNSYATLTEQQVKFAALIAGLQNHLAAGSTLSAWMLANDVRVHPNIKHIYPSAAANTIFVDSVVQLGSFSVSGADTGTFTAGTPLSATMYAAAVSELVVTSATIGTSSITVTVSGTDDDGDPLVCTSKVIPDTAVQDDTVALEVDERLRSVTGISITGGEAGDAFAVQTVVERTIAFVP